jgi:hypothetical protein
MSRKFYRLPSQFDKPRLKQCGFWWAIDLYGRPKKRKSPLKSQEAAFLDDIVYAFLKKKK